MLLFPYQVIKNAACSHVHAPKKPVSHLILLLTNYNRANTIFQKFLVPVLDIIFIFQ